MPSPHTSVLDLLIVGAGINGAGIARDAAGRGLAVALCEQGDIGGATSSASSKLIHGGLRYLEQGALKLVAEALAERKTLLRLAPHLAHPLRFVLPQSSIRGFGRPRWQVAAGLMLYEALARLHGGRDPGRYALPRFTTLDLARSPLGMPLRPEFAKGYCYFDVAVDDARLTLANVRAAADLGAAVWRDTRFVAARREGAAWIVSLASNAGMREIAARAIINASGPWVMETLAGLPPGKSQRRSQAAVQLVRGSHIVVPRRYAGDHAYILQNDDGRVVFLLPFADAYTLIGTTEIKVATAGEAQVSMAEIDYLCRAANRYCRQGIGKEDVLWSYAGIRPLFDDGKRDPSRITRDYHFLLDGSAQAAPALSIFGGKLTTYRRLAERALDKLAPWLPQMGRAWSASAPLPGGDIASMDELELALRHRHPRLPVALIGALARRHGSLAAAVLGEAQTEEDLGRSFGAGIYEREVRYFVGREWARRPEDILWRRSKAGLTMSAAGQRALAEFLAGLEAPEEAPPAAPRAFAAPAT